MNSNEVNIHSRRRNFLKKAAYVAPVVLAMGSLTANAQAGGSAILNQAVKGTEGNAISITKSDGTTQVIKPSSTSPLSGFNSFLHRSK